MTKYSFLAVVSLCLVLLALPAVAKSHPKSGDRVCIYTDDHFHGHEQCFAPGDQVTDLKHAEIESIRVYGHARVTLYEDRDFAGRMMEFSTDVKDLHHLPMSDSKSWNNRVGSLRVSPDTGYFEDQY